MQSNILDQVKAAYAAHFAMNAFQMLHYYNPGYFTQEKLWPLEIIGFPEDQLMKALHHPEDKQFHETIVMRLMRDLEADSADEMGVFWKAVTVVVEACSYFKQEKHNVF